MKRCIQSILRDFKGDLLQLYSTNSLPFVYIYGFIQSNLELRECEKKCEQNRPSHLVNPSTARPSNRLTSNSPIVAQRAQPQSAVIALI